MLGRIVDPLQVIAEWAAAVHRRGNVVTRFPDGPHRGELAERYRDASGHPRYALPPDAVRSAALSIEASDAADRATGDDLQRYQDALRGVWRGVAAVPRHILADVAGIPPWIIPVGAIILLIALGRTIVRRVG